MKSPIIPRKGAYYINEFWFSKAYQSLSCKTRDLLQCFITELIWKHIKLGKRQDYTAINNGDISFTETSFRKLTGCAKETYRIGIRQLIERGIITITYRGGSGKGDRSKYKLLCIKGISEKEQRWMKYPNENWSKDIKICQNYCIGKKTRFKK